MARERYEVSIECPQCGQTGTLKVSENDYPFMRKLNRAVDCKEGEFDVNMINDSDANITCKKCNHNFKW
jgi:endogenous inhibitor of DNA gyrase (YacG/DUF329 family)